jgi:hypothetical protein
VEDFKNLQAEFDADKQELLSKIVIKNYDYSAYSLEVSFLDIKQLLGNASNSAQKKFWIFMEKYRDIVGNKVLELIHYGDFEKILQAFFEELCLSGGEKKLSEQRNLCATVVKCPQFPWPKNNQNIEEDYKVLSRWMLELNTLKHYKMAWRMLEHAVKQKK